MIIFGWIMASIGAVGLTLSAILELKYKEPIYMTLSKISAGILGIGGIILAVLALTQLE